jgi:hypothetical protein
MLAVHFNTTSFCFYVKLIHKRLEILAQSLARLPIVALAGVCHLRCEAKCAFQFPRISKIRKSLEEPEAIFAT